MDSWHLIRVSPMHGDPSSDTGELISIIHSLPLLLAGIDNTIILAPGNGVVRQLNAALMEHVEVRAFSSFSVDETEFPPR